MEGLNMNKIRKQLGKIAEESNGQMRIVDVPKDRIPTYESLVKLDTEIASQVGKRNIRYKGIIRSDITDKNVALRISELKQDFYTKKQVNMECDELIDFLKNAMNYDEMQIWLLRQQTHGIKPTLDDMLKKFFQLKTNEDIMKLYDIEQNYNQNNIDNIRKTLKKKR